MSLKNEQQKSDARQGDRREEVRRMMNEFKAERGRILSEAIRKAGGISGLGVVGEPLPEGPDR